MKSEQIMEIIYCLRRVINIIFPIEYWCPNNISWLNLEQFCLAKIKNKNKTQTIRKQSKSQMKANIWHIMNILWTEHKPVSFTSWLPDFNFNFIFVGGYRYRYVFGFEFEFVRHFSRRHSLTHSPSLQNTNHALRLLNG